mmetsp:Transcript_26257/g.64822  ORF Transcript_26257/g.64822 Transcript_26257/m.64822 type:complete len:209 (+) Transcript_26257:129-755(+)
MLTSSSQCTERNFLGRAVAGRVRRRCFILNDKDKHSGCSSFPHKHADLAPVALGDAQLVVAVGRVEDAWTLRGDLGDDRGREVGGVDPDGVAELLQWPVGVLGLALREDDLDAASEVGLERQGVAEGQPCRARGRRQERVDDGDLQVDLEHVVALARVEVDVLKDGADLDGRDGAQVPGQEGHDVGRLEDEERVPRSPAPAPAARREG